ncbi:hypothetical protein L7F22_064509 [Adiantum nelumboides]|nr:hypothetical protein [Adiantum nelumboides]
MRMSQITLSRLPCPSSPPSSWVSLRSCKQSRTVWFELTDIRSSASSIQVQNHKPVEGAVVPITTSDLMRPIPDSPQKDTAPSLGNIGLRTESDGTSLSIVVVGATGELARSKIFPALFALFHKGCLPKNLHILGYSRSELSNESLKDMISENLTCRVDHPHDCGETVRSFLSRVFYQSGGYDSCEGMSQLNAQLQKLEVSLPLNFYSFLRVSC